MIERVFGRKKKLENFSLLCDYFKSKHVYLNDNYILTHFFDSLLTHHSNHP